MGLAVIAAEDQKFSDHWGFDVPAIEKALAHNERNEKSNSRRVDAVAADGKKTCFFMGWP